MKNGFLSNGQKQDKHIPIDKTYINRISQINTQNMIYEGLHTMEPITAASEKLESYFQCGEKYYHAFMQLRDGGGGEDEQSEKEYQKQYHKSIAIEAFLQCVKSTVSHEQQNIRIHALYRLVMLHTDREVVDEKERYFYQAVELIEHYYEDNFQNTPEWEETISIYLHHIHRELITIFPMEYIPLISPLLSIQILSESKLKIQKRLEDTADILQSGIYPATHSEILYWIENIFGPVRIFIRSEGGNEMILSHGFDSAKQIEPYINPNFIHHTTVDIFDKKTRYEVSIDRGGMGEKDGFRQSHLEHIIYPMIDIYIRKKEYALFLDASDHEAYIQGCEDNMKHSYRQKDYTYFIDHVFRKYSIDDHKERLLICQQSIDIARIIRGDDRHKGHNLSGQIDTLLGGSIRRDTLKMVQSHFMTRHETMNGTGYPFGLSKQHIPIESRIYSIIRAYEALYTMYPHHPYKIHTILKDWGAGGYFDTDILTLFLDILSDETSPLTITPIDTHKKVSKYREKIYQPYIHQWKKIIQNIKSIENYYDVFRSESENREQKKSIIKSMNEGILILRYIANIRTIFIITRHGETESDIIGGPPGDDDEHIGEIGISSSRQKGEYLQDMKIRIFSSPLPRATESARLICEKVLHCIKDSCISCPHMHEVDILKNPTKDRENGRYNSYAQKLFRDNTHDLMEFLIDTASSSEESTNLCITHRDSGRHLIFWLTNLFSQEKAIGEKIRIENDTILTYLFQGDRCIEWNLVFPISGWKTLLDEINSMSQEIFGLPFYPKSYINIDLIDLHDRFLDFLDYHREHSREQFSEFRKRLQDNPITRNCSKMIDI